MFKGIYLIILFLFLNSCAIGEPLEYEYSIDLSNIVAEDQAEFACEATGRTLANIKEAWNGNELQNFITDNCPYDTEINMYSDCWVMTNNGIRLINAERAGGYDIFHTPTNFSMASPICERVIND